MIIPNIKFSNFKSEAQFNWLKKQFMAEDYKSDPLDGLKAMVNSNSNPPVPPKDLPHNPIIHIEIQDSLTGSQDTLRREFYRDYLMPAISRMAGNYFFNFKDHLEEKGIYEEKAIEGFAKQTINKINQEIKNLKNTDYLIKDVKIALQQEINQLFSLIEDYLKNPYPEIANKLRLKCKRTDVIYFFHLLRKNKVIGEISESDLGRIIDNLFEYSENSTKDFKSINNSRKHLNEFWNETGRSASPANKRLKNIFQNDDFYNI